MLKWRTALERALLVAAAGLAVATVPQAAVAQCALVDPGSGLITTPDASLVWDDGGGEKLYLGGRFEVAVGAPGDPVQTLRLATWDGTTLQPVAIPTPEFRPIHMTLWAGRLAVVDEGPELTRMWAFDGQTWEPLGPAQPEFVYTIGTYGARLLIGTRVVVNGAQHAFLEYVSGEWIPFEGGLSGPELDVAGMAILEHEGQLYLGGAFRTAGGLPVSNIVRWDGQGFQALGTGLRLLVRSIAVEFGRIYVGAGNRPIRGRGQGDADALAASYAQWDGAAWQALQLPGASEVGGGIGVAQYFRVGDELLTAGLRLRVAFDGGDVWVAPVVIGDELIARRPLAIAPRSGAGYYSRWRSLQGRLFLVGRDIELTNEPTAARVQLAEFACKLRPGDTNCDGAVTSDDIAAFINALVDPRAYYATHGYCDRRTADVDADGAVDVSDIAGFVALLTDGG